VDHAVTEGAEPDAVPGVVPAATRAQLPMVALAVGQVCERPADDAQAVLAGMDEGAERSPCDGAGTFAFEDGAIHRIRRDSIAGRALPEASSFSSPRR
jgi:hypothetical protein